MLISCLQMNEIMTTDDNYTAGGCIIVVRMGGAYLRTLPFAQREGNASTSVVKLGEGSILSGLKPLL